MSPPATFNEIPDVWPIGIGAPCIGCTEKSVAFKVPMFEVVKLHTIAARPRHMRRSLRQRPSAQWLPAFWELALARRWEQAIWPRASFPKWRTMRAHRGRNPIARVRAVVTASREHRHEHSAEPSQAFKVMIGLGGTAATALLPTQLQGEHGHERQDRGASREPNCTTRRSRDALRQYSLHRLQSLHAGLQRSQRPANGHRRFSGGIWDMPMGLNAKTKTSLSSIRIRRAMNSRSSRNSALHCLDPACVTGCPFGSLVETVISAL